LTAWTHLNYMQVFTPANTMKAVSMRKPLIGIMLAGALCAGGWLSSAAAQDPGAANQEPSLADAARKAKAQKKSEPQAKQVWTDENLPKTPHEVPAASAEGGATETGAAAGEKAGEKTAATPADDENKKKAELEAKWRQKFGDAHKRLDDDQKDLELMQREYSLKQQQYYNDPNTAMRQQYNNYAGGRGPELNDLQKKMEEKKQKIEQDKQAISDLEDQLRKEGLPPGWARP
jgi:hypothetical protein